MVNLVAAQKPLLHWLMNKAGVKPYTVEIEPGTTMNFWVPKQTLKKSKKDHHVHTLTSDSPKKPVVVLVHGFAGDGIVTWQFQVGALTKNYAVYVPDLLFFGGSVTDNPDRSPTFQAECLVKGLKKLGVDKCVLVGFSYGGMVAFKVAELYPELVRAMVVSGSIFAMNESVSEEVMTKLGFSSSSELLLPTSVKGLKTLLSVATHKKFWFPNRLYKDYLQVMFTNRKERDELLQALVISNENTAIPRFSHRIHLLWGENDQIFRLEFAQNMKQQLGEDATLQGIKKGGHLVHLERPCAYNRCLKKFLASVHGETAKK